MRHPPKGRRRRPPQNSPFLRLPPEIRNQIYRVALISPLPIDLCPAKYASTMAEFDDNIVMHQRCAKYMTSIRDHDHEFIYHPDWPVKVAFRLHSGLESVRKNLVVQLLAVCCQIYNEAAAYFWTGNIWRFSDDDNWEFLWRFLLTIGANARSLVQNMEVLAPHVLARVHLPAMTNWKVKNHPKLRMAKAWLPEWDWHDFVWQLWSRERSLRKLKMIIPSDSVIPSYDEIIRLFYEMNIMQFSAKTQVFVERGGVLGDPATILHYGWDVVALPGSHVLTDTLRKSAVATATLLGHQDHLRVWVSDLDYLIGVMQLFEVEEVSVHANGGRAKPRRDERRLYRLLGAFGPCVIVDNYVPCHCWRCQRYRGWYYGHLQYHCPVYAGYKSLVDAQQEDVPP